jgi:metallophosphoesterase (TIGR03767 family)
MELAPDAPTAARRASLLHFAFVTDLHLLDAESPGRFEFVERFHDHEPLRLLMPAYRPQEFLQLQATEAMIRTLNAVGGSPLTGAPVQCIVCGGDHADNAQVNELRWASDLLAGGMVQPGSGGPAYEGVTSLDWNDDAYWRPDAGADDYKTRWGYPTHAGLLDDAQRPFLAAGIRLPWLSCYGNHDGLAQGTALATPAFGHVVTGSQKARALPRDADPQVSPHRLLAHLEAYIAQPELLLAGPATPVTPDPARRLARRDEFVQMLMQAGGEPVGHGFTARNLAEQTAYYVDDRHQAVRLIVLDTVNPGGHYQGSIGAAQLAWLERRLAEVHSQYRDERGRIVRAGHEDRLVVIVSHHGLDSLTNDRAAPPEEPDSPRVLGPALAAVLHRFPNMVLWVNGHTHRHAVRPRPDPEGRTTGFWEVTTGSLIGWPCQARLVEIVANGNGTLSVLCTMVDHMAPPDVASAGELLRLAALHRELAANDPHAGVPAGLAGQPSDRNAELVIPAPFALG